MTTQHPTPADDGAAPAPDETFAPEGAVELARIRRSGFVETRHLGSNPQPHT